MNDHKIAFIACVNDEEQFQEALYYIDRLYVPQGYETDVIAVREAPSMAEGYNAAMMSSDAKYKIYLHQDVCLIYRNLLTDMLETFQNDENIGMLGVLGCRMMPKNAAVIFRWDTGKVFCNQNPACYFGYEKKERLPLDVAAVDGMFMATQYDVKWREDLFDGWDFYDISQSFEFQRVKKKVVIPFQKEIWCYHDNRYSKLNRYHEYREKLIEEYGHEYMLEMEQEKSYGYEVEYEKLRRQALAGIRELIETGNIEEVCDWLKQPENRGEPAFKEIELICRIYEFERQNKSQKYIYTEGESFEKLMNRFQRIKHLVKRIEFGCECEPDETEIAENYSVYAVAMVIITYAYNRKKLYERILQIYREQDEKKYVVYKRLSPVFETDEMRHTLLQYLKKGVMDDTAKKRLVIVKALTEENVKEIEKQEDKKNTTLLVENYMDNVLERICRAQVVCGTVEQLVTDMQDGLYNDYCEVVIYGKRQEEYVKVFHNTDVPVKWHMGMKGSYISKYSKNIKIC